MRSSKFFFLHWVEDDLEKIRFAIFQSCSVCRFKNTAFRIGHVLNEQGTGYEHIFSWYEHSISIELKMGHVI